MQAAEELTRVLVVDDEPQVLVAVEDLLGDEFIVFKSESAEGALRLVEEEPDISVVISDQRMPRMNGDELLKRLRERSEAARILLTGYADLSAVVRAVNEGQIFAYVTKPWDPEDLRLKIQRAAQHFRLNQHLTHERQLLDDLMASMPDAIYFKDRDHRFLKVNQVMLDFARQSDVNKIFGQRLSDVLHDRERALAVEADERAIFERGESRLDVLTEFKTESGVRWFSTTKAPVRNATGEVVGLVGISRDVTQRVETEEALRRSEERLRLSFRGSNAGLFDWDMTTDAVTYSQDLADPRVDGVSGASIPLADLESKVHPDDVPRLRAAIRSHLDERVPFRALELRARAADGQYRWFETSGQAVWDSAGKPLRLVGSSIDITDRKEQAERIARLTRTHAVLSGINSLILRTRARPQLLQESCRIAVRVGGLSLVAVVAASSESAELTAWDGEGGALLSTITGWLSAECERRSGLVATAVSGACTVINDLGRDSRVPFGAELLRQGHRAMAVLPVTSSGRLDSVFALFADHAEFFDADQLELLAELAQNIGFALEHTAQAERLEFLAYYDELTRLPNRRLLMDRIERQLALGHEGQSKLAVVLVDIGRFRQVNETLGRSAGDALLVNVASRLRGVVEESGTLARFDSNTFAVLMVPENESQVAHWVERAALPALVESAVISGTELRIAVKLGIAMSPSDGRNAETLIANAEAALKKAKPSGQPYLFYAPSMNSRVAEKLTLETKLRRALERDEFLLHYQPKVDLKTGRVVGLEALIRWQDPESGLVPPGRFIPILEETGLILDVGKWVLDHAATQYTGWVKEGAEPPRVAVNVSALQLGQHDFVSILEGLVERFPLSPAGIDLEITESVLMEDLAGNISKLRSAKDAGFRVAIDDFGTGYSSLGYLSRLPIDALKVDRSFILRMSEDPQDMSIVTTIISLAHALEQKVIAEGVETAHQAQLLRLLRCDEIQGYLIAKPQPAQQAVELMARRFEFTGFAAVGKSA